MLYRTVGQVPSGVLHLRSTRWSLVWHRSLSGSEVMFWAKVSFGFGGRRGAQSPDPPPPFSLLLRPPVPWTNQPRALSFRCTSALPLTSPTCPEERLELGHLPCPHSLWPICGPAKSRSCCTTSEGSSRATLSSGVYAWTWCSDCRCSQPGS